MDNEFTELLPMKKSRKRPVEGDVFVIQPKESIFYFGKVIKTNIQSKNVMFQGMNLIYMYNCSSNMKEVPVNLDEYDLLFPPIVVNFQGWLKGYFETVGNQPVTAREANLDFGFFDNYETQDKFYNLEGERIQHKPKYIEFHGLKSYGYVGRHVHRIVFGKQYE